MCAEQSAALSGAAVPKPDCKNNCIVKKMSCKNKCDAKMQLQCKKFKFVAFGYRQRYKNGGDVSMQSQSKEINQIFV